MKIRLAISDEHMEEVIQLLESKGIEIDDDAEYTLIQNNKYVEHITTKNEKTGEKAYISVDEILYIESFGHQIEIRTNEGLYLGKDPLYQLEGMLEPKKFTRISKSVIVANAKIKQINPSFAMKFTLIMVDGKKLEVTRGYYYSFKNVFHI